MQLEKDVARRARQERLEAATECNVLQSFKVKPHRGGAAARGQSATYGAIERRDLYLVGLVRRQMPASGVAVVRDLWLQTEKAERHTAQSNVQRVPLRVTALPVII